MQLGKKLSVGEVVEDFSEEEAPVAAPEPVAEQPAVAPAPRSVEQPVAAHAED
jgi:hypothetical protein